MENIDVIKLIYDFKRHDSMLWVEDNDIELLVSESFKSQELKETITKFKTQIIASLIYNGLFSKEDFLKKSILKVNCNETFLSFAQERLWFIEQYEGKSNAYHVPSLYELDVDTNIEGIKYALKKIVERHEILRTTIERGDKLGVGVQRINDKPLSIDEVTLNDTEDYRCLIKEEVNRYFDLSIDYPIRANFFNIRSTVKNNPNKTLLLVNSHHIAFDGWSVDIFEKELFAYYEAFVKGDNYFDLPTLEIHYKDYAIWQKTYLVDQILEKQLNYWKNKLAGYYTLELPTDYLRPGIIDYKGDWCNFSINKNVSKRLRELSRSYGVTLQSVMLSSINILLGKYTGQDDIIIGSPIANRHHRQTEGLIGFFVNTQANRTILNKSQNFIDLFQQVQRDQIEAQMHQDLPFEKLVDELAVERDLSRHPIFQVMCGVQNFGDHNKFSDNQKKYLKPHSLENFYEVARFDLSIFIDDSQEELTGQISYATSLFHKDTILRLINHYNFLLDQMTQEPDKPCSQFGLLNEREYSQIVNEWNATDREYPEDKTFYQLFEEQAEKTPDNIAVVCESEALTYSELNKKSNQLANYIRAVYQEKTKQFFSPDTIIALCLDRSLEMAVGILAVLKAGGAYIPLDTTYPKERIEYMLEDTGAVFVLATKNIMESSTQLPNDKVILIDLQEELYKTGDYSNLQRNSTPEDLAYIIYTSGSTGKPKGAMIEHKGMLNHLYAKIDLLNLDERSIVAQNASQCFDISVWQLMAAVLCGGKVIIYTSEVILNPSQFINKLDNDSTTVLEVVPSYLSAMLDGLENNIGSSLKSIKYLLVTGEELKANLVKRWFEKFPKILLINAYGPTEAADDITHHLMNKYEESKCVPIGKPVQNLKVYIINNSMQLCPVGVQGEICVSGVGVGRGYINNSVKTNEVFVNDPFSKEENKRMYKTGDIGRWLPDGIIQYMGRKDDQVKVRGYRIELGEIEEVLTQIEGIHQACVLVKERKTESGSTKYLVGYYVSDHHNELLNPTIIHDMLSKTLPDYMIPAAFVNMDSFPLTENGKLNKIAFPQPDFSLSEQGYVAPTSLTEKATCNIWQEVLGLNKVGIFDDFFKIGGNSILAIQVSHQMSKISGCDVKVADVFKLKNIHAILTKVEALHLTNDHVEWEV